MTDVIVLKKCRWGEPGAQVQLSDADFLEAQKEGWVRRVEEESKKAK